MDSHPPLGDDINTSNLGAGRVFKRPRIESQTTQLVEQERATGDVNGFQGTENFDPTELKRQKVRERYARMTEEQKAHMNAKRRENYHRKKAENRVGILPPETFSSYPVQLPTNMPTETSVIFHPIGEGIAVDVQDQLRKNDTNTRYDTNTSNLGVGRVFKRPRIESQTTQLVLQERATEDVNGFQDIENIDPTELLRQKNSSAVTTNSFRSKVKDRPREK